MKKITLVLCLSLVGLVGMAQQTESSKQTTDPLHQENSFIIKLNDHQELVTIDKTWITDNDFSRNIDFRNNNHEMVHHTINNSKFDFKLNQEAFSYNQDVAYDDYTIHYERESMLEGSEIATV